jgi:hypothetical protein
MTSQIVDFTIKVAGSILALTALFLTWRTHSERTTFEMIDRLYSLCHTLENHLLREWQLSHLFCIRKEDYDQTRDAIRSSVDPAKLTELRIKEELFAVHVFVIYEQVYYQWRHSTYTFHGPRKLFLGEMLYYFTERLLRNPRLLAMARADRTGVSLHLEKCSMEYFLNSLPKTIDLPSDPYGPFSDKPDGGSRAEGAPE